MIKRSVSLLLRLLQCVLGCVLFLFLFASTAFADESQKNVLLFNSDDTSHPANVLVDRAIRSTLKEHWKSSLQVYDEGTDSLRIPNEKYEAELLTLLKRKYEGVHLDLIFALGPPALRFLLKYQGELFSGSPIVFLVADPSRIADLKLGSNVTGVSTKVELTPTLDLALTLQPKTQRVVLVAGTSSFDQELMAQAKKEFRPYEGKLTFDYLSGLTQEELRQRLGVLPERTIVIYLSMVSDNSGKAYFASELLSPLVASSSAPIYGVFQTHFGFGIVGGDLVSFEAAGTAAASVGLRIIAGESPQNIAPQTIPSVIMFDWRQLQRWHLNESKLPADSIVRFKEFSVWELYKWRIIGAISLIIFQTLLIVYLLIVRGKRNQAQAESTHFSAMAVDEHRRLEEIVANVQGIVWESRLVPGSTDRKTTFVSSYAETMLGYSVDKWLSTPHFAFTLMPEEDRERVSRESDAVIRNGTDGVSQFRWVAKDGRVLWIETYLAAICDETGATIGLRGISIDITDRKHAEEDLRKSGEKLKEAQRIAVVGSWEWDPAEDKVVWSEELFRIMGRDPSLPAPNYREHPVLYTPESWDRLRSAVETCLATGKPYELELQAIRGDGKVLWTYARGESLKDSNGGVRKLRGTLQDVADRKQAEEALREALEEVSHLKNKLEQEIIYLREEIKLAHNFDEIVGRSDEANYVLYKIEQVAPTDSTVLITGETGTGKELVARAIHSASVRRDQPLIKVNCGALSASLIESELFGHEKGAFTGATARKIGRFELANDATIFLDEIGELPLELQVKLLRVVQEGEFERLGSAKTIKVNARIIAATNRNLKTAVEQGTFREDLWYRLNVYPITVPPLRNRKEDIPDLVQHFTRKFADKIGKNILSISPVALEALKEHIWPGNIRELANVIERAVIHCEGSVLRLADQLEKPTDRDTFAITMEEIERQHIIHILDYTGWIIEGEKGAAKILGLKPSTLRTRMAKLRIQRTERGLAAGSAES
jgi:PAS domain S-box-containing protein